MSPKPFPAGFRYFSAILVHERSHLERGSGKGVNLPSFSVAALRPTVGNTVGETTHSLGGRVWVWSWVWVRVWAWVWVWAWGEVWAFFFFFVGVWVGVCVGAGVCICVWNWGRIRGWIQLARTQTPGIVPL